MLVSFIFTWQKDTDRLREGEFFSFKSRARWHASSVASLLPAVIFMTHDVIGQPCFWEGQRVRPHTNGHTAVLFIPLAVSPLSDLKCRLTCLALGLYWHVFSSVYTQLSVCSFPVWYLTFTQSFTSFTHFFTHDYNVFLFCFSTPSLIPFVTFCRLQTSQEIDRRTNRLPVYEMSLDAPPNCLFNCGSNRLRNMERMRPVIYPDGLLVEVWGWPAHCGNTTLAFLGIADRFQDHCVFFPLAFSSFVCSGWHVWLFIVREKGVAGAINMWLHCILFSTEKAVSFNRYLRPL